MIDIIYRALPTETVVSDSANKRLSLLGNQLILVRINSDQFILNVEERSEVWVFVLKPNADLSELPNASETNLFGESSPVPSEHL